MGGAEKRETCHTLPRWSDRTTSHRGYKSHSSLIEKMCFKLSLLGVTKELDDINRSMGTLSWLNLELTVTRNRTPCGNTRHYIRTMCGVAYCKLLAAWSTCSPKVRGWHPGSGIFHVTPDFHFYTRPMIWDLSSKLLTWKISPRLWYRRPEIDKRESFFGIVWVLLSSKVIWHLFCPYFLRKMGRNSL